MPQSIPPTPSRPGRGSRFNLNRAQVVDENFVEFVRSLAGISPSRDATGGSSARVFDDGTSSAGRKPPIIPDIGHPARAEARGSPVTRRDPGEAIVPGATLTCRDAVELFESQIAARVQDIVAREMRARNEGFYTIGSAGHEGNAVIGRLTRHTDIAFLHYRSGAFMAERARKVPDIDFVRDTMLSFAAAADEPIAGGRHKVWGSVPLWVPPQTSTIASHLPKAVGAALAIPRAKRFGLSLPIPDDSIVVCSFGDASANHAVAQTAFNTASLTAFQRLPVPILFVCEDNGIGISVETPPGWIEAQFRNAPGIAYYHANGLDLVETHRVATQAIEHCRARRQPVFLHLKVVRLLGHAGSDPETEYHTFEQIEAAEARDPLLATADLLISAGIVTPNEALDLYERTRSRVREAAEIAAKRPKLSSAAEIIAPLAPRSPDAIAGEVAREPNHEERVRVFGGEDKLPERQPPRHMASLINAGLHDLLIKHPEALIFGEDVAKKGGVYHVTTGLSARFGVGRVYNTMLDETSILGMAIGAAHLGMLPIPEIQYLAYYHNAEDQVRGEACSLRFFSNGRFRNPMVIRIAGWGYQKGFGGHFHNDNSIAALRDVPGLVICSPSRGDDAVRMMRTCLAMAKVDGSVIAFIEPIALYMTRDLFEPKDALWSFAYPPPGEAIAFGEGAVYTGDSVRFCTEPRPSGSGPREPRASARAETPRSEPGAPAMGLTEPRPSGSGPAPDDLTIITFANGVPMSLRAAQTLREQRKANARVIDLRWLNPLNESFIIEQATATGRVLVVDEGRRTGGVSEAIMTVLYEHCRDTVRAIRLTALDTYIPLGPAADHVLPSVDAVLAAACNVLAGDNDASPASQPKKRTAARR